MALLTDQMGRTVQVPDQPQRIISLVPSQTELLHDLGLGDRVVGITKFCVRPEAWFRGKPRVGGTKKVDLAKVRALQPDLIIGNKEENERKDIEALTEELPVWMSDVRDLPGALEMILALGDLTGTREKAEELERTIAQAFTDLRPLDPPQTAAYLIWRDPLMVAGDATFVNDMLKRCGLVNVFDEGDARYPELTPLELAEAGPELILLSSEPYPFNGQHMAEIRGICPAAEVHLVDGEAFSWYGSRLLQATAYFQAFIDRLPPRE